MATKPTDKPFWATSRTIEAVGGTGRVVTPSSTKQQDGWDFEETPPSAFVNWLARLAGDWIDWFDDFNQNHVHDGQGGNYSAPPIKFPRTGIAREIEFGTNGEMLLETDTVSEYEISIIGTGLTVLRCDQVRSDASVQFSESVEMKDNSGLVGADNVQFNSIESDDVCVESDAFSPRLGSSPSSNFSSFAPQSNSIYRDNITAAICHVRFQSDGAGSVQIYATDGYNLKTAFLFEDPDTYRFEIAEESGVQGFCEASVELDSGVPDQIYRAQARYVTNFDGNGNNAVFVRIWVYSFINDSWVNIRSGSSVANGAIFSVNVTVY